MNKPTDSELEILQILWENGSQTVREVNDRLNQQKQVGYTTTLKFMQIMHEKGLLNREKKGKGHLYTASISQEKTQEQFVDRMLDTVFKGSAMKLVMQALGNKKSSKQELEEIKSFIEKLEKGQNN